MGLAAALALPGEPLAARAPARSPFPQPRPATGTAGAVPARAAGAAPALAPAAPLEQLLARANLGGVTGLAALDVATGELIEAHQPDAALPPASVTKAATALYALHGLGLEHRFITRLRTSAAIQGGVLRGDLVLEGGGDPTLQTEHLAELAQQLVARHGLSRVEGRLIVDDAALPRIDTIDAGQVPQAGYSPGIAGMNLNFNRVHFAWRVAGGRLELGLDARSAREVPPVSVIRIAARDGDGPVYTYARRDGREHWTVARRVLTADGSRWLPVRQPGLYAGDVLRALLAARGCTVPAPQIGRPGGGAVLAEHRSDPMPAMVRDMLRFSTNITAENLGLATSLRGGSNVQSLAASAGRMSSWLSGRYAVPGLAFVDHSGLGEGSRVSAAAMARLLLAARREGVLPDLLRAHTMRDAQGREMSNHPVAVRAKTGTLNFVSGLGGYAQAPGGRQIAFAIFSANAARRAAIPEADRERPPGAAEWARRARALQQGLIERWAALHG